MPVSPRSRCSTVSFFFPAQWIRANGRSSSACR
jgi:hypothetical protein